MKRRHNLTFSSKEKEWIIPKLQQIGIRLKDNSLINFKINEDARQWPEVKRLMEEFHMKIDMCEALFSEEELRAASWLVMEPAWHHGYPQPEDEYRVKTYNLITYCEKCGIGKVQTAPFQMKGEPKWGKRHILQLNWVFDEYFVTPEVWKQVFKPKGIASTPVIHHRRGKELKTVVQLRVDTILEEALHMKAFPYEVCPKCNRKKYPPISGTTFPAMKSVPRHIHAVKSREYFGSGASAFRALFVSQELYSEIVQQKLKGVNFVVVDEKWNATVQMG